MNKAIGLGVGLALLMISVGPAMAVSQGEGCTKIAEITTGADNVISSKPSRVCSVTLRATAANAFAEVFDSPDGTSAHGQARRIAEPGQATSGSESHEYFGERGRWSEFGLGAYVVNGRLYVAYDD